MILFLALVCLYSKSTFAAPSAFSVPGLRIITELQPAPLDLEILDLIKDETGLSLISLYRALMDHEKSSILSVISYLNKRGADPLIKYYRVQIAAQQHLCDLLSEDDRSQSEPDDQGCFETIKKVEEEMKRLVRLQKVGTQSGQMDAKVQLAFSVFSHQVFTEVLQKRYQKVQSRCEGVMNSSCNKNIANLNRVGMALSQLGRLLDLNLGVKEKNEIQSQLKVLFSP